MAAIANFSTTADASIVALSLPRVGDALNAEAEMLVWVIAAYLLTSVGLVLGMGRLSDAVGTRRVFTGGFLIFTVGLVLCAVAQTVIHLILFRVVTAVGVAMLLSSMVSLAVEAFPRKERGRAMGVMGAATSLGLAMGPLAGGILLDEVGWRSVFYLRVPIGIVGVFLGAVVLHERRRELDSLRFDYWGAVSVFMGLVALAVAANQAMSWGLTSMKFLGVSLFAIVILIVFVRIEARVRQPVFDMRVLHNRTYVSGIGSMLLYFVAVGTAYYLMPFFLLNGRQVSAAVAGLLFAVMPFCMGMVSPFAGAIGDRVGTRLPVMIGFVLIIASIISMGLFGQTTALALVVVVLVVHGLGAGFFEAPNISAIMGSVSKEKLGLAAASVAISRQVGLMLGMVVGGAIFVARRDGYLMSGDESWAVVAGFSEAVMAMAVVAAAGAVVAMLRPRNS